MLTLNVTDCGKLSSLVKELLHYGKDREGWYDTSILGNGYETLHFNCASGVWQDDETQREGPGYTSLIRYYLEMRDIPSDDDNQAEQIIVEVLDRYSTIDFLERDFRKAVKRVTGKEVPEGIVTLPDKPPDTDQTSKSRPKVLEPEPVKPVKVRPKDDHKTVPFCHDELLVAKLGWFSDIAHQVRCRLVDHVHEQQRSMTGKYPARLKYPYQLNYLSSLITHWKKDWPALKELPDEVGRNTARRVSEGFERGEDEATLKKRSEHISLHFDYTPISIDPLGNYQIHIPKFGKVRIDEDKIPSRKKQHLLELLSRFAEFRGTRIRINPKGQLYAGISFHRKPGSEWFKPKGANLAAGAKTTRIWNCVVEVFESKERMTTEELIVILKEAGLEVSAKELASIILEMGGVKASLVTSKRLKGYRASDFKFDKEDDAEPIEPEES